MAELFEKIRENVMTGRYLVSEHASERLDERGILEWQVVDGIEHSKLLAERALDQPNPVVEVLELLADGMEIKAVWSLLILIDVAKLVTVHFIES